MVRKHWISVALIFLVAICFGHVCFADFVLLDDPLYITDNPQVQGGLTWTNMRWSITDSSYLVGFWIPTTWVTLQADASVFGGKSAWGYHLMNVVWHAANAVLFLMVLQRMTGDVWRSAVAATIYAIHPLRVESVAWITERKDVLSGLFLLLAVGAYYRYSIRPSWQRYGLVYLCFILGMASKPSVVTLPCSLLLLDYWPLGRLRWGQSVPGVVDMPGSSWQYLVLEKLPFFATSMVFGLLTVHFSAEIGATDVDSRWYARLSVAASGYLDYLKNSIWPINLAAFYPLQIPSPGRVMLATTILIAITAGLIYVGRTRPALIVGWFWFLGTLFPVSGIVQTGLQGMADRFTYIPHLGLAITAVWGIGSLGTWRRLSLSFQKAIIGAVIAVLAGLTWMQVLYWNNTEMLLVHTLNVTEKNPDVHNFLSKHWLVERQFELAEQHGALAVKEAPHDFRFRYQYARVLSGQGKNRDAITQLEAPACVLSDNPDVHALLGLCLANVGRSAEAKSHLQRAMDLLQNRLAYDPFRGDTTLRRVVPYLSLGQILLNEGDAEKALAALEGALEIKPDLAVCFQMIGIAQGRKERWTEAEHAFLKAIELERNDVKSRGYLAMTYMRQGHRDRAVREYASIVASMPDFPRRNDRLAMDLITNLQLRDIRTAEELATQACEATDLKDARHLNTLAAVQAAKGAFFKAQATAKTALTLTADTAVVESLQERLRLYERGQALPLIGENGKRD